MNEFQDFFKKLFQSNGFMPRWRCGNWTDAHGWLYIVSNVVIGLSYFAIPLILFYFISKKKDIPFRKVFILFSAFIIFCGFTHFTDALMFWFPVYRLNAILLMLTAIISAVTVFALYKKLPEIFSLKSPRQLQEIIDEQTAALQLANQQLKASAQQFKALVNSNPDIITLMGQNLDYKFVNDAFSGHSILNMNQVIGKKPDDILPDHPHTIDFTNNLKKVFKEGENLNYELETMTSKVDSGYFSVNMIPLFDKSKQVTDVLTITKDITIIRKNELQLNETIHSLNRQTKRLELNKNTLQDFNYIVSHNLRSPVGNISSLITIYNISKDPAKQQTILSKIFEVFNQLSNTVQDLGEVLNKSNIAEIDKEELDFEVMLQNQITSLTAQIMYSKAAISYDFSACKTIVYPKVYLESIILNLLTNALKYADLERTPKIVFTSYLKNGIISFTCKDNGVGLDLNKYGNKIFSLHKTFHDRPDSRGVGLFITKNQINSLGGSIKIESEPGVGSTFIIHFNEIDL